MNGHGDVEGDEGRYEGDDGRRRAISACVEDPKKSLRKEAWQMQEERDGEVSNPGPESPESATAPFEGDLQDPWSCDVEGQLIVETINITAVSTNQRQLCERKPHVAGFQEHGAVSGECCNPNG